MNTAHTIGSLRTWGDGMRCGECCNGDRCDDPTHFDRRYCPHCKGTGWALWTEAGRNDYVAYLVQRGSMSEAEASAAIRRLMPDTPQNDFTRNTG
jgi:hypothetical protein